MSGPPSGVPRATHKSAQESRVQEGGGDVYLHTCVHSESACLQECACVFASYPRAEVRSVRMHGVRPACAGTYGSGVQTCAEVSPYVCASGVCMCTRVRAWVCAGGATVVEMTDGQCPELLAPRVPPQL